MPTRKTESRIAAFAAGLALLMSFSACSVPRSSPTPQRPTFSSDTSTTAHGTAELEAGVGIDPRDSFDSPLSLKFGLSEASEIFVGWSPYQWVERSGVDARGGSETLVGMRQRFLDESEDSLRPSAAVQLATKLPTGSEKQGLSTGEVDFFAAGILTRTFTDTTVTGFYQLGFLGEPDDSDYDLEHGLAMAAATPAFENTSLFGELAAVVSPEQDREEVFTTLGMSYSLSDSLVLDAAVVVGLSSDAPDLQVLLGFTQNLGSVTSWLGRATAPSSNSD